MSVQRNKSKMEANRLAVFQVAPIMLLAVFLQSALLLSHAAQSPAAMSKGEQSPAATRAFPRVSLGEGHQLEYVGSFSADGKFKPLSKFGLFIDSMKTASGIDEAHVKPAERLEQDDAIMKQVPPVVELPRNERAIEDFQPPERAVQVAKGHSVVGELRDSFVSLAYGANRVLVSPQCVTTDSQHRVIVTDPDAHGLHVLAYNPKDSFQIIGGPGRRLRSPSCVAVDDEDNIYVTDSERGLVLVYDSAGKFLRTIGSFGDEGLFEGPSGIAIDAKAGHLYVVDPPRHTLFVLDLKGNVLARVGARDETGLGFGKRIKTGSTKPGEFKNPQAVLIHNSELIVLDSTRVHILNLKGQFQREFVLAPSSDSTTGPPEAGKSPVVPPGLFMDAGNHIYVSDPASGTIREYSHEGQLLASIGRPGVRMGEFYGPSGMWADSGGRVYIVDARRIQVFQLSSTK